MLNFFHMPAILFLMFASFQQHIDAQQDQNDRQNKLGIFVKIKTIELDEQKDDADRGNEPTLDRPDSVNQRADADHNQQNRAGLAKAAGSGFADKY